MSRPSPDSDYRMRWTPIRDLPQRLLWRAALRAARDLTCPPPDAIELHMFYARRLLTACKALQRGALSYDGMICQLSRMRKAKAWLASDHGVTAMQERCGWAKPVAARIYREFLCIAEELPSACIRLSSPVTLLVTTDPITFDMEDGNPLELGVMDMTFYLQVGRESSILVHALTPAPHAINGVIHPHVAVDRLCLGNAQGGVAAAMQTGRINDAVHLALQCMVSYNADSAYGLLSTWRTLWCGRCNRNKPSSEVAPCSICGNPRCAECRRYCAACTMSTCSGCRPCCTSCGEKYCPHCAGQLSKCQTCASGGLAWMVCACGAEIPDDDVLRCYSCNAAVCEDCYSWCGSCAVATCHDCTRACVGCTGAVCDNCARHCVVCHESYCADCYAPTGDRCSRCAEDSE